MAAITTPALLDALRSQPDLPDGVWYTVVAAALCQLNRPREIQTVYTHACKCCSSSSRAPAAHHHHDDDDDEQQLRIARRLREALLKTSAVGGMPKTINALQELNKVVPPHLWDLPAPHDASPSGRRRDTMDAATPASAVLARGRAFFDRCYGKVAARVMEALDRGSGTEDLGLAVRVVYGYVLSPTAILSDAETSFVVIAALVPQDVNPQLKGHLKGALNGGASVEQVRAVRRLAIDVCKVAGMRILTDEDAPGGWGWRTEVQDL